MTNSQATSSGILYIVATPIGNKDDISLRGMSTLKSVDFIIAEDTRHSAPLLKQYAIQKPLTSLHAFNEEKKSEQIIQKLLQGQSAALISDAGTPLISDPGYPLVHMAREEGIEVSPIPGASAIIAAISASGLPCDSFTFAGFLPVKSAARQKKLDKLKQLEHTVILYEAKHRIINLLEDMKTCFGADFECMLVKEISKSNERFIMDKVDGLIQWLQSDPAHQKGEFVVLIPPQKTEQNENEATKIIDLLLKEGIPVKQISRIVSQITGANKNEIYQQVLKQRTI